MTLSGAPQAAEWAEVVDALHTLLNVVTIRSHYPAGHPAIAQADQAAGLHFVRLFQRLPEVVLALIDGEFLVSERPRPELRERLPGLAELMLRHGVECFVFQRGIGADECTAFGEVFSAAPSSEDPVRFREQAQARFAHVLLRYAELKAQGGPRDAGETAADVEPAVHEMLADVARAIASAGPLQLESVRKVARDIVARCADRSFALAQRCHAEGVDDLATHSANVAAMTAAMALRAGIATSVCVEATAGALLHDVGRLLLPVSVRGKPEPLLDERARQQFRHHPFLGARALLACGCPALWVAAALEHHRGVDGKGYPTFGSPAPPHELVRMVALANFFDDKRTLLPGKLDAPLDVLRAACALEGRYFDRASLDLFMRALGAFPPGTTVELSDRSAAVVTRVNPSDATRPEVRILVGSQVGRRVDLKTRSAVERRHELSIVRAIAPPLMLRKAPAGGDDEAWRTPTRADLYSIAAPGSEAISLPPVGRSAAPPASLSARPSRGPPLPREEAPEPTPPVQSRSSQRVPAPSLDRIPMIALGKAEIAKLPLNPTAGFVMSLVDEASSLEVIVDSSGLGGEKVLEVMQELVRLGVITWK